MENVSDGGSECFDFGNVVLVKYKISVRFNAIARENEELIAAAANKKRDMGVNTHIIWQLKE